MKAYSLALLFCISFIFSCSDDFLDRYPKGTISEVQLNTPENAEKMVIAAYAAQGNEYYGLEPLNPWPYGDLRGGDAHKGGAGIGDLPQWNDQENFIYLTPDNHGVGGVWNFQYRCISRANQALNILNNVDFPKKINRIAEMRFLRSNNYFWLKIMYRHIPFIDENVPLPEYNKISNDFPDEQIWGKIVEDLEFAIENLDDDVVDGVGRPTKHAARAYLAKVLLYAAYEQNEKHEVVNINKDKLNRVVSLCDEVLQKSGKNLFADFGDNFECGTQNGIESIWAIQFSHNDGTPGGRFDGTKLVVYPMVEEYGCCGYHTPSQNLVNAFFTVNGLPRFDNYNDKEHCNAETVKQNTIDPRLLHTVAMDGLPYKYKADHIYDEVTWSRQRETYGPYLSMKETVRYDDPCYQPYNPWKSDSKNRDVLRIDDVILWKAEALIQLDRQAEALPLINQIRNRAAQSTNKLKDVNGNPTGNFDIRPYVDGTNCTWNKEFAFKALQWERRMEFACEGFRAYDLMRWGVMNEVINAYLDVERYRRPHLLNAKFTKGRDEYLPIQKGQIDQALGVYIQNPGY